MEPREDVIQATTNEGHLSDGVGIYGRSEEKPEEEQRRWCCPRYWSVRYFYRRHREGSKAAPANRPKDEATTLVPLIVKGL
jgi:hypothetical protein